MKPIYTLHKLPEGFIITSDELIKDRDFTLSPTDNKVFQMHKVFVSVDIENYKKVIAQQDHIYFSALSEEEQKRIGWFDVISLGEDATNLRILEHKTTSQVARQYYDGYLDGFQKAQELLSERFTLEDVQIAITQAFLSGMERIEEITDVQNHIIQSLSQKSWKIELEMENYCGSPYTTEKCPKCIDTCDRAYFRPKLTNGKITITKIL
jgi:hypothetical protein